METEISKWGNSLAVRIPAELAKEMGIKVGSHAEIKLEKKRLVISPKSKNKRKYTLAELVGGITSENCHGETGSSEVGREAVEW